MDVQTSLRQAVDIALLKEHSMKAVASDKEALPMAFAIVILSGLIGGLGFLVFPPSFGMVVYKYDFMWLLGHLLISSVMGILSLYVTGFLAERVFKAKISMEEYVRVAGFASIVGVINVIPVLAFFSGIWSLVILWTILSRLGKMEGGQIVLLILVEIIVLLVLGGAGRGMMF